MMIHYLHEKTTVVWLSALLAFSQAAYANKNADEPDYTKGDAFELSFPYALGPTGAFGNIWVPKGHTGRTDKTHMIQVAKVDAGSPSDGVLKPFDVILGIGDNSFKSDIRKELAAAIAEAEKNENQGELVLKIWRPELEMGEVREYLTGAAWHQARKEGKNILKDGRKSYILVNKAVPKKTNEGKHIKVTLHLPIMGSFSKTSPWECPKTKAIIDKTAEQIVKKGLVIPARIHPRTKEPIPPQAKGGIANLIDALGLLATGGISGLGSTPRGLSAGRILILMRLRAAAAGDGRTPPFSWQNTTWQPRMPMSFRQSGNLRMKLPWEPAM